MYSSPFYGLTSLEKKPEIFFKSTFSTGSTKSSRGGVGARLSREALCYQF